MDSPQSLEHFKKICSTIEISPDYYKPEHRPYLVQLACILLKYQDSYSKYRTDTAFIRNFKDNIKIKENAPSFRANSRQNYRDKSQQKLRKRNGHLVN